MISIPTLIIGIAVEGPVAHEAVGRQVGGKGRVFQFITRSVIVRIIDASASAVQIRLNRVGARSIVLGGRGVVIAGGGVGAAGNGCTGCPIVQCGDFFLGEGAVVNGDVVYQSFWIFRLRWIAPVTDNEILVG
jgi:hypothetical protein